MKRKLSFRGTLITVVLVLLLSSVLAVGTASFLNHRFTVEDLSTQVLSQTSKRIEERIQVMLDRAADEGFTQAQLAEQNAVNLSDFPSYAKHWVSIVQGRNDIYGLFAFSQADNVVRSVSWITPQEVVIQEARFNPETHELEIRKYRPQEYPTRPYLEEKGRGSQLPLWIAQAKGTPPNSASWTQSYQFLGRGRSHDSPGITFVAPIHRGGKELEAIGVHITLQELSRSLAELNISSNGFAFVVEVSNDGKRKVVASPSRGSESKAGAEPEIAPSEMIELQDRRLFGFLANVPNKLDWDEVESGITPVTFEFEGARYIGGYRPLKKASDAQSSIQNNPRWLICVVLPEADVMARVTKNNYWTAGIGLAAVVAAMVIGILISHQISRALVQVAREADRVGRLELDARPPITSIVVEVNQLGSAMEQMKSGLRSFCKYLPSDVVQILFDSRREAELGNERRNLTMQFCDLANFSAVAEKLPPEHLVEQLGDFYNEVSQQIEQTQGKVDKFLGDAVMSFWGAPNADPQHAWHACVSAVRSMKAMKELQEKWQARGRPPFSVRIGINTGFVLVGNFGSSNRLNYSVIGDAVNVASRLESLNKVYGSRIIIGESTYQEAKAGIVVRPLDWVAVKGKTEAIAIYELLGLKGETPAEDEQLASAFSSAMVAYRAGNWPLALSQFEEIVAAWPADGPAKVMIARCRHYQQAPPDQPWDGVHRFLSK